MELTPEPTLEKERSIEEIVESMCEKCDELAQIWDDIGNLLQNIENVEGVPNDNTRRKTE